MQPMFPMQPYAPPPPQLRPMQASAGMGEYMPMAEAAAGFGGAPGIQPFEASAGMGAAAIQPFEAAAGMGAYVSYPVRGPRASGWKAVAAISPLAGALGQVADAVTDKKEAAQVGIAAGVTTGVVVGVVLAGLLLRGGAGYVVGRALAPSEREETAYAWGGVMASIFLGTLGLGIEALVAGAKR